MGVSLQEPREAKEDKAFGPTTNGSMLGINFDTVAWKWWISEEKVIRYTNDLSDIKNSSVVKTVSDLVFSGQGALRCQLGAGK